ncbi:MAG: YHYH protein [Blastocatellia bacterium]|nr:YHYH protein [Blastocatellia bacterium]
MNKTLSKIILIIGCLAINCAFVQAQPGGQGDGIWVRNAYYGEAHTFDKCLGHQPGNGQYHHHAHPICLRAQLDDNLIAVNTSRTGTVYREKSAPWKHSPILGWAFDGYPIYGPYGYSDPTNTNSAVKRLKSSFQLRSFTQRTTLPTWALAHHAGLSQQLSANQYGPDVSDAFPVGRYIEDYDFVSGAGDLDQYNGRFAITPEYPGGTYAYYATINDDGSPAFPYIIGMQYYGNVTGNATTTAPANAQSYFSNGAYAQTITGIPQLNSWFTKNSQQNAQIVSGFAPSAGAQTTWPTNVPSGGRANGSVNTPTKADTQTINYTDSTVYITANNLASYTMGPWFIDGANGGVFPNFPSAQNNRGQIPRAPSVATTKQATGLGAVGLWVNGVAVFNVLDGASYSNAQRNDIGGGGVRLSSLHVSSASFEGGPVAQGALVSAFSLFGAKLATSSIGASSADWPTTLGGATVSIRDAAGTTHAATINYASPAQVNYRVPEAAATGFATVTITANGIATSGAINIASASPSLFFNFNGEYTAAGYLTRVRNEQINNEPIIQTSNGGVIPLPIDLGPETDQVYLILFGSGLGKADTATAVSANLGGVNVVPTYAGAQGTWGGLAQFNVPVPRAMVGKGKVDIILTVNGKASNTVTVTFK